jgi:hypothetical protein
MCLLCVLYQADHAIKGHEPVPVAPVELRFNAFRFILGKVCTLSGNPMKRLKLMLGVVGAFIAFSAMAYDRIAAIGESAPISSGVREANTYNKLVDIVHALDKATHSSSKIVVLPFSRSLKDTAGGSADFHLPLIQNDNAPPPEGLAYVTDVDFGYAQFVIYSRKAAPLNAQNLVGAKHIETEPGHESLFPFPVSVTNCVPCSLDKVLFGRTDALVVSSEVVDPLLRNPKYKGLHRELYKSYPIRALVPTKKESTATRRYLIDGVTRIKKTGELWRIIQSNLPYSDWQP